MNTWLTVFLGGGLGSILRYGIGVFFHQIVPARFPYATLVSNSLSSIILGLFLGIVLIKNINDPALRYFIIVGFCGGLSTFSSFSLETYDLFRTGMFALAIANILLSLVLCILFVALGIWIGKSI
jgi:fluoride exporter